MKRQFKFIFLNLLIFLFGCSLPDTTTESLSKAQAIDQVSIQLVSYTTTLADVKVSGQLPAQGTTLINTVSLFSNSMCVGTSLKTGLSSDFKNTGFVIQLPVPQTSSIYLKTNTLDNCFYLGDFIFSPGQNLTPSFNRFDPQSPSTLTLQPLIFGQAWPNTQVKFYSDLTCATLIGQGSDTEFRTSGIYLQIQAQTTNHIYSQVVDVLGNTSSCTLLSDYVHSPVVVDNPVFGSTDPTTPSKSSVTPLVKGAVNSTATDIELYSDTGCVNLIGSGTQTDFQSSGIQINTTANSSTTVYARAKNSSNQLSSCTFLTIYTHDSVAPADPIYLSADPTSPTRLTIFPLLKGQLSADASSVRFFTSPLCLASANIGTGSKYEFESTGVPVTVLDNNITSVYAQALDAAGNSSNCVFMVSYKHNTIPPLPPTITGTIPESPNNVTASPVINGVSSENTKNIYFYSDDQCLSQIGTSTATAFDASGSLIHTPSVPNSINATTIYTRVDDIEGNLSDCISVALYEYSTAKAADPSLLYTIPASPSRTSYRPWVIGTAPSSVTEIGLYSDNNCQTQLGVTSRVQFSSQGIQSILPQNTTSPIYSKTKDKYGNTSDCNILTTYTHDTYKPINPSFVSTNPLSPNNTVMNPLVIGSTINSYVGKPLATTKVHLYDSFLCLTKVGSSNVTAFNNSGITAGLSPNTLNTVYAQTADDAGNLSDCTFMTNYVYTTKKPGVPVLSSTVPASPSYSEKIKVFGQIGYTDSVLAASTVKFFKDSICSQNIGQGAVNDFTQSSGVAVTVDLNQMTDIYGQTYDAVGNKSDCVSLSNFKHYNLPPQNLQAVVNQNGSVTLTWQADQISSPSPKYIIKRSTQSGGPYSVISWTTQGNQFIDLSVQRNKTYYYVVAATNITGHSQDSNQASASIAAGILGQPISLQALAGPSYVDLSWIGSPSSMEYEVLRSTISGGPYTTLVDRLYTTNYSDKSVVNGQIYYYRVVSKNQAGSLVSSAEVSALPLGVSSQNPIQLKYTLYNFHPNCPGKAVFLSWTAPSYYTNFQIRAGLGYSQLKIVQVSSGSNTLICLSTYNGLSRQMYFDVQA